MDERKIRALILVMWERLLKCDEIDGNYPYIDDFRFRTILESCGIDPNELDDFLMPLGLK